MCGIVGRVSRSRPVARDAFERMTDRLAHRGPDGRGTFYARDERVALGHRRLSIVDLSPAGSQPMTLADAGLALVYNGEIYNHPELRAELESHGHVYRSHCDTETVLHAYARWGEDCVSRFRGIFSFALWDDRRGQLFAARDHLGVKPFYYLDEDQGLAFASQPGAFLELPGFEPRIDPQGFLDYLSYGVVPGDRAVYRGVSKLPPGHVLTWRDGSVRTRSFWRPPERADIHDPDAAARALEDALESVVAMQLRSDVPVATFLSGGIDSSLITAIAGARRDEPTTAYTIGFDVERSDERAYAARAAEHCGARPVVEVLTAADVERTIDDAVEAYDEPFGIGAALPMVAISRLAAAHGTKVVLSGDGADELFAGYRHYDDLARHYRRAGRVTAERVGNWPRHLLARARHGRFDPLQAYKCHNAELAGTARERLCGPALRDVVSGRWRESDRFRRDLGAVEAGRRCDLDTYLPDEILVKVDRASMRFGIEARVPFLDPALVELAFRIAPGLHYAGGERKALLKRAAARWLPADVLGLRKKGFSAPLGEWLRAGDAQRRMRAELAEGHLVETGLLDAEALAPTLGALRRPMAGLLQLYLLERWARRWLGGADARAGPA